MEKFWLRIIIRICYFSNLQKTYSLFSSCLVSKQHTSLTTLSQLFFLFFIIIFHIILYEIWCRCHEFHYILYHAKYPSQDRADNMWLPLIFTTLPWLLFRCSWKYYFLFMLDFVSIFFILLFLLLFIFCLFTWFYPIHFSITKRRSISKKNHFCSEGKCGGEEKGVVVQCKVESANMLASAYMTVCGMHLLIYSSFSNQLLIYNHCCRCLCVRVCVCIKVKIQKLMENI